MVAVGDDKDAGHTWHTLLSVLHRGSTDSTGGQAEETHRGDATND